MRRWRLAATRGAESAMGVALERSAKLPHAEPLAACGVQGQQAPVSRGYPSIGKASGSSLSRITHILGLISIRVFSLNSRLSA